MIIFFTCVSKPLKKFHTFWKKLLSRAVLLSSPWVFHIFFRYFFYFISISQPSKTAIVSSKICLYLREKYFLCTRFSRDLSCTWLRSNNCIKGKNLRNLMSNFSDMIDRGSPKKKKRCRAFAITLSIWNHDTTEFLAIHFITLGLEYYSGPDFTRILWFHNLPLNTFRNKTKALVYAYHVIHIYVIYILVTSRVNSL